MYAVDPNRLLRDAFAAARRAPPSGSGGRPALERVAQAALDRGVVDLVGEVLLELEEPAGRAWLHAELAARLLQRKEVEGVRRHLDTARDLLDAPGRWRPRGPAWMGPDAARARLASLYARLGDLQTAEEMADALPLGQPPRALAWRSLVEQAFHAGVADPLSLWRSAREAALTIVEPTENLRARVALAGVACRRGDAVRASSLAHTPEGDALQEPLQRAALGEQIGLILAEGGRPDAAARTWHRALRHLLGGDTLSLPEARVLCRIARHQLAWVGPDTAVEVLREAILLLRDEPLPPDPDLGFAWQLFYETGLQEPTLAEPLRDWLRVQARVPPGWCFVLGLLERATGHVQRARWAADALDRGHAANPTDGESGWLAAVLWLILGETDRGLVSAQRVLESVPPGRTVHIPGSRMGPMALEQVLAETLLSVGQGAAASSLARASEDAVLRGRLLGRAAVLALSEGAAAEALALGSEAATSLVDAGAPASAWVPEAAGLVALLEELGNHEAASQLLDVAVAAAADAPGELSVTSLCGLARTLEQVGSPGAARPRQALAARVAQAAAPGPRCDLLLQWLDLAHPPLRADGG